MKEVFFRYIDDHQQELIELIQEIVQIPSVNNKAILHYPFGENIGYCLESVLLQAQQMGFRTVNLDGYMGYAEYGEGDDYIVILGHLDVVPEGEGWNYPPYGAEIHQGNLYGRGVLDNKAPILSCLFALKCLKDCACHFPHRIRILFGTDEESGFRDIPYYLDQEKIPLMGFTPDCKFPVVYGENGILQLQIIRECSPASILLESLQGNFRPSVVPEFCQMNFKLFHIDTKPLLTALQKAPLSYTFNDNLLSISYKGKQAPANNPYLGDNAIVQLISYLPQEFIQQSNIKDFITLFQNSLEDIYGNQLDMAFHDEIMGDLMITVYELCYRDNQIGVNLTLRYPLTCPIDFIFSQLQERFDNYTILRYMPAVHFALDHPLVKELSVAYHEITGLNSDPVTTTGGTYAKMMPNIVAFGPSFPGERGIAHNPDEYMSITHIVFMTKIYTYALYRMANLIIEDK
ncbi:MAG: Sapep family Mn(2+)-dependent dipeptidase [Brevinema sp.]